MLLYHILQLSEMIMNRKRILFEQEDKGPEWVVVYYLGHDEFDDDPDSEDMTEIVLNALNFDTAVRYAQQYLRKMQTEENTSIQWKDAEILSIELHT